MNVFIIAYGESADKNVLQRIADVIGGRLFEADTDTLSGVYLSITAEQ